MPEMTWVVLVVGVFGFGLVGWLTERGTQRLLAQWRDEWSRQAREWAAWAQRSHEEWAAWSRRAEEDHHALIAGMRGLRGR